MIEPAGVSVLAVPTLTVSNVWVNDPVSAPTSEPDVTVGIAAELVVES